MKKYFKKLVKQQALSVKIYVYIDSESQITLFLVGITKITLSPNLSQKSKKFDI